MLYPECCILICPSEHTAGLRLAFLTPLTIPLLLGKVSPAPAAKTAGITEREGDLPAPLVPSPQMRAKRFHKDEASSHKAGARFLSRISPKFSHYNAHTMENATSNFKSCVVTQWHFCGSVVYRNQLRRARLNPHSSVGLAGFLKSPFLTITFWHLN